jgi:hypothetical protein
MHSTGSAGQLPSAQDALDHAELASFMSVVIGSLDALLLEWECQALPTEKGD